MLNHELDRQQADEGSKFQLHGQWVLLGPAGHLVSRLPTPTHAASNEG